MKDPKIEELVTQLHSAVTSVNAIMEILQDLKVDVKVSYVDPRTAENYNKEDIKQSIKVWRIEERNDYLE
jgi:hypothetical protein